MSEEKSRQVFQKIWNKVAKPGPDGRKLIVIRNRADLEYHWWSGLVDEDKYSMQDWVAAFQDSLLPNGGYLVTEEQWVAKAEFHYAGPIATPYDPMTIREGEWGEEELNDLVWNKLKPCVYFSKDDWGKIIGEVKRTLPKKNGKYVISHPLKQEWTTFVNTYASPRRILQLGVYQLRAQQKGQAGPLGPSPSTPAATGYAQGPAQSRTIADRLSQLIGKRNQ